MKIRFVLGAFAAAVCVNSYAADTIALSTDEQKFSYVVGYQFGMTLKQDGLKVDTKAVSQAIQDAMSATPPRLTQEQMQSVMEIYRKKHDQERLAVADKNQKAGQAYLANNKKQAEVKELANGIQYKVLKAGTGKKPKASDSVMVNYRGTLINGEEFDSSYKRGQPVKFRVDQVIKGWQEVLQLMPTGSKWQAVIPAKLAYGAQGTGGPIGPNETLIFEIELLEIK